MSLMLPNKTTFKTLFASRYARWFIPLSVGLIVAIGSAMWILYWARFGLDFTDEGFYLNTLNNPSAYHATTTQFGYIYGPLFSILGRDIIWSRQANILLTLSLASILLYLLAPRAPLTSPKGMVRIVVAGLLAPAALLSVLIQTPSYNSLNIQGLVIAGIAFVLIGSDEARRACVGAILLGLAGTITFAAKPPTGAFLGALAVGYLLYTKGRDFRFIVLAGASAIIVLLAMALLIDGSPAAFVHRLDQGLVLNRLMQGYTLKILSPFDRLWPGIAMLSTWLGWVVFGTVTGLLTFSQRPWQTKVALGIALLCGAGTSAIIIGNLPSRSMPGVMLIGFHCGIAMSVAIRYFCHRQTIDVPGRAFALAAALAAIPFVYAVGTNNNFWMVAARASFFLVAANLYVVTLLHENRWKSIFSIALISNAITIIILCNGVLHPYRAHQSLEKNSRVVDLGEYGKSPVLSIGDAAYLDALRAVAARSRFEPGTPVIDLTGQFPTSLYALNALPIGQAWTIGGYVGSAARAKTALSMVPCETVAQSWLLYDPRSPRRINAAAIGVDLRRYAPVGAVASPREGSLQYLMQPREPLANRSSCKERHASTARIR